MYKEPLCDGAVLKTKLQFHQIKAGHEKFTVIVYGMKFLGHAQVLERRCVRAAGRRTYARERDDGGWEYLPSRMTRGLTVGCMPLT